MGPVSVGFNDSPGDSKLQPGLSVAALWECREPAAWLSSED